MRVRLFLAISLALYLTGCARIELESQNYQFNQGIGNINAQLLLLNSVRASKKYPLQFTSTSSYTGDARVSGGLTGAFPFGPGAVNPIYSLAPSLNWRTGLSQVQVADLNTTKATQYFRKSITGSDFRYYYIHNGDRNLSLISLLLIDYIRIKDSLFFSMVSKSRALCASGDSEFATDAAAFREQCEFIERYVRSCPKPARTTALGTQTLLIFGAEYTGDECRDRQIRLASFVLQVVGFNIQGNTPKDSAKEDAKPANGGSDKGNKGKGEKTDDDQAKKPEPDAGLGSSLGVFYFADPEFERLAKVTRGKEKETPIDVTFRSPESMVRFLGSLISAQTHRSPPVIPTIFDFETKKEVPIFTVHRGLAIPTQAAVEVRDGEGEHFYIPVPDRSEGAKNLTLETLSIVADVVNTATAQAEIPQVPNVTLRVSQ